MLALPRGNRRLRPISPKLLSALILALMLFLAALAPVVHPRHTGHPIRLGNGVTTGDLVLYRDIDEAVRHGADYYQTAARLQRERNYPLRPFLTVRPPTLSWAYGLAGPSGMIVLAVLAIGASALLWHRRLREAGLFTRVAAPGVIAFVGAMGMDEKLICSHEWWSGLMLSCALALDRQRNFGLQLAFATLATLLRELAAPFLLLMLATSLWHREWRRAGAVFAVFLTLIGLLLLHRAAVDHVLLPTDRPSPGWLSLRGIYGFTDDLALLTALDHLWQPFTVFLTLAPLAGWARHPEMPGLPWFAGFAVLIAIAARPDNFYWSQMLLPAYPLGLLLLITPRSVSKPAGKQGTPAAV